jgi:hypothetical protein
MCRALLPAYGMPSASAPPLRNHNNNVVSAPMNGFQYPVADYNNNNNIQYFYQQQQSLHIPQQRAVTQHVAIVSGEFYSFHLPPDLHENENHACQLYSCMPVISSIFENRGIFFNQSCSESRHNYNSQVNCGSGTS